MKLPLEPWVEDLTRGGPQTQQFVKQFPRIWWIFEPATGETFYRSGELQTLMDGQQSAQMSREDWFALIHNDDRDRVREAWDRGSPAKPLTLDYRLVTACGEVRWVRDRSFSLVAAIAQRHFWVLSAEDITAEKQTQLALERRNSDLEQRLVRLESELHQAKAQLENAEQTLLERPPQKQIEALVQRLLVSIESVNEGITVSDCEGNFAIYNNKMAEITGYSREEANNAADFLELLYPNARERQNAIGGIESVCRGGNCRDLETTIRAKDGTDRTLLVSSSSLDYQGKTWLLSAYRDISDRKRAEQALKLLVEREGSLRTLAYRLGDTQQIADILNIAVEAARNFLRADRTLIYRFEADGSGRVIVESSAPGWPSAQSWHFHPEGVRAFEQPIALEETPAQLVTPVRVEVESNGGASKLWGLLVVHQCSYPRQWQPLERNFLSQLAVQLGLAINQAERYHQLEVANQFLESQVAVDSLTQVANRRKFDEYLLQEWKRLARQQQPLSLMMCDVDYFKAYNDTYGHQQGDRTLQQIARTLNENARRSTDLVARYGGEEFAIILPNTPLVGALHLAETMGEQVRLLNLPHPHSAAGDRVTLSLGVATTIPEAAGELELLIAAADRALYQAKARGRDRAVAEELPRPETTPYGPGSDALGD